MVSTKAEEVEAQLKQIVQGHSSKQNLDGLDILFRLLSNILKNPNEDKFRQIKGSNAKIASTLFALKGARELLLTMGYQELEPNVFVFIGDDLSVINRYSQLVDEALQPIRLEFMSPEEREKALLIMKNQAEQKRKQEEKRAAMDLLKR